MLKMCTHKLSATFIFDMVLLVKKLIIRSMKCILNATTKTYACGLNMLNSDECVERLVLSAEMVEFLWMIYCIDRKVLFRYFELMGPKIMYDDQIADLWKLL